MAIKIATMIGDNYGSALQAFALQQSIKECGGGGGKHCKTAAQKLYHTICENLSDTHEV